MAARSAPAGLRLAERTTLRVGGPADAWILADDEGALVAAVRACDRGGTPVLLLGGGSNLLVSDEGFRGSVVDVGVRGLSVREEAGAVVVTAAAGESWDDVAALAAEHGWPGVEALSGIPGRVGAVPVQNVGAYGQEVADVLSAVRVLDRRSGEVGELGPAECGFGYRTSRFKTEPDRWVVLGVRLRLPAVGVASVRYGDLAAELGVELGGTAPVADVRRAVLALRTRKAMVLDPADHDTWSAGSFFTNPVVDASVAERLPSACPRYRAVGGTKVSAAWLIEQAGIGRGFAVPGSAAAISSRHTLALTNTGGASAAEVVELARVVRAAVESAFAITLVPEPRLVGCAL